MIHCPKCGCAEARIHSTLVNISMVKERGWFGREVPRGTVRGLECSCAECLSTFVVQDGGAFLTPSQKAYDALAAAQKAALDAGNGKGPMPKSEAATRQNPRPAPDPRTRRK